MKRTGLSDARQFLNNLLDRLEAKPNTGRLFSYIDENAFSTVETRDHFIDAMRVAAKLGGIKLDDTRKSGEAVLRVRLTDAGALYDHLGRIPSHRQVEETLTNLHKLVCLPETGKALLDDIGAAWTRGVRKFGIAPSAIADLKNALALACALQDRLDHGTATAIDFRTFARAAGTDSKALDRLAATVIAIHASLYPQHAVPYDGLTQDDMLATFGVLRAPQPLLLSGPVAIHGVILPDLFYYGFPPDQGDAITLAGSVDYVLTIENYSSFIRHAREMNGNRRGLVLYTAGFPARSHLMQIVRISSEAKVPTYHWGDIDPGGVRIFRHLESALRAKNIRLRPHLMDTLTLKNQGVRRVGGNPLLKDGGAGSAIADLWLALCETGLMLEQESLSPQIPL